MKHNFMKPLQAITLSGVIALASAHAGIYSEATGDNTNAFDAPVAGFVGPDGEGKARLDNGSDGFDNENNYINPIFFDWADVVTSYTRADGQSGFSNPSLALGEVTGNNFDVVSLGDLTSSQITNGDPAGSLTLEFLNPISNFSGADFVIYENGFLASGTSNVFAELAYVEVSDDGINFLRFESVSDTSSAVGAFSAIDSTDIFNLAGKHANAFGESWGTPFDIAELGLSQISHIRLVDIPGDGSFTDAGGDPIYDPWQTFGSGGADIEAVGSISTAMTFSNWPQLQNITNAADRDPDDDPDGDGYTNLEEYAFAMLPWQNDSGAAPLKLELVNQGGTLAAEFLFPRDERLSDLTYEIWVSNDLSNWNLMATSTAGQPLQKDPAFSTATVTDTSSSENQSIGVLRQVRIRDTASVQSEPKRFFRVIISQTPMP
ncbi:MAG: hypothetical protein AAF571_08865 [Verrucomicrobiota bacterium]